jgi:hypothetical protein
MVYKQYTWKDHTTDGYLLCGLFMYQQIVLYWFCRIRIHSRASPNSVLALSSGISVQQLLWQLLRAGNGDRAVTDVTGNA